MSATAAMTPATSPPPHTPAMVDRTEHENDQPRTPDQKHTSTECQTSPPITPSINLARYMKDVTSRERPEKLTSNEEQVLTYLTTKKMSTTVDKTTLNIQTKGRVSNLHNITLLAYTILLLVHLEVLSLPLDNIGLILKKCLG